jgi:hypothetical protein
MALTLALFDMAATTVDDTIDGRPLVLQSFADSFHTAHVSVPSRSSTSTGGFSPCPSLAESM